METTYKTNGSVTTKSMTEWYFGKKFVDKLTEAAKLMHEATGEKSFKFWQNGTGHLTIEIN